MSSPTDWTQFYHQNLSGQQPPPSSDRITMFDDRLSESTIVTTTTAATTTATTTPTMQNLSGQSASSSAGHLSPEGRVTKPIRRRSRASRRTPTTLLNTDATNFRAMVQQFTGGPSAHHLGAPSFNFGLGGGRGGLINPRAIMVNPTGLSSSSSSSYHLQYQQLSPGQQTPSAYNNMFSMSGNSNNVVSNDVFLQRLGGGGGNLRPALNMAGSDGFGAVIDGGGGGGAGSQQVPTAEDSSTTTTNENRVNSFMF